jgi:hypothetical protein
MLDLSKTDFPIKHHSECLPGIMRQEIYQLYDMVYTERYDDLSEQFLYGNITMYGDVRVCMVGADGGISMNVPTGWITDHKSMMMLIDDLTQLDVSLSFISEQYRK